MSARCQIQSSGPSFCPRSIRALLFSIKVVLGADTAHATTPTPAPRSRCDVGANEPRTLDVRANASIAAANVAGARFTAYAIADRSSVIDGVSPDRYDSVSRRAVAM